jgi:hypothetical protein
MVKAEKKFVVAYTHAQARHFAESMDWARAEWAYVSHPAQLDGMHSILVFDVRAPKYKPSLRESSKMADMQSALLVASTSGRIARINVANLP